MRSTAIALILFGLSLVLVSDAYGQMILTPGQGAGAIKLGTVSEDDFIRLSKKADLMELVNFTCPREGKKEERYEIWLTFRQKGIVLVFEHEATDGRRKMRMIIVTHRGYVIRQSGIRVGSRASLVSQHFSNPDEGMRVRISSDRELWKYPEAGVFFRLRRDTKEVESITIVPPGFNECD